MNQLHTKKSLVIVFALISTVTLGQARFIATSMKTVKSGGWSEIKGITQFTFERVKNDYLMEFKTPKGRTLGYTKNIKTEITGDPSAQSFTWVCYSEKEDKWSTTSVILVLYEKKEQFEITLMKGADKAEFKGYVVGL